MMKLRTSETQPPPFLLEWVVLHFRIAVIAISGCECFFCLFFYYLNTLKSKKKYFSERVVFGDGKIYLNRFFLKMHLLIFPKTCVTHN